MALDRDELVARCYLAIITPLDGCAPVEDWDYEVLSDTATKAADALISRLAPAPSLSLADGEWRDARGGAAPSPAASPAPYVPKVGDVVKHTTETDKTATADSVRVVVSTDPLRWVYVGGGVTGEWCEPKGWEDEVRFVRPATAAERAAAGLPPAESARQEPVAGDSRPASGQVDREGLIAAMDKAVGKWWGDRSDNRRNYEVLADAALAYLARATRDGGVA